MVDLLARMLNFLSIFNRLCVYGKFDTTHFVAHLSVFYEEEG